MPVASAYFFCSSACSCCAIFARPDSNFKFIKLMYCSMWPNFIWIWHLSITWWIRLLFRKSGTFASWNKEMNNCSLKITKFKRLLWSMLHNQSHWWSMVAICRFILYQSCVHCLEQMTVIKPIWQLMGSTISLCRSNSLKRNEMFVAIFVKHISNFTIG